MFRTESVSQANSTAQVPIYDLRDPFTYEDLGLTPVEPDGCPFWTEEDYR
jgi:hypothetical protein